MSTVLILIENRSNRRLLSELLAAEFETLSVSGPEDLDRPFDVAILDSPSLDRHKEWIDIRRGKERPVFLPFLLIASRSDLGYATRQLWKTCDEIILSPIEKIELRARLQVLLRARTYSKELENRYFALARSAPVGVFLLKGHNTIWVNPFLENLLGQSLEDLTQVPWDEWFLSDDRAAIRQAIKESGDLAKGRIVRFASPTGTRWAEVRVTQVGPTESQGFLGVISDVTGEREIARIKDEFLSSVSHELRTPLTAILGFSEFLLENVSGDEIWEYIHHIHGHAEHLAQSIGDLLNIAQLRAGWALPLEKSTFDLRKTIEEVLSRTRRTHSDRIFTVRSLETLSLYADQRLIIQAFTNLLDNAIKFSSSGASVEVNLKRTPTSVRIEVIDRGRGMTSEQAAKAQEVFFRADSSMSAIGGFGLGLTIARAIAEEHGGNLDIESRPGQGTKASLVLPASLESCGEEH